MADTFIANEVSLNGTTPVTILAAPAAATQRITANGAVGVYNLDTVDHTITFQKDKAGVKTKIASVFAGSLKGVAILPKKVVLDATDESLEALSDAAATTTEPKADVAALECT